MTRTAETVKTWKTLFGLEATLTYSAGEHVFGAGSPPADVYVINEGLIKLSCNLADGGQTILALRFPGHFLGRLGPISGNPHSLTATAVVDSALFRIPAHDLRKIVREKAEAAEFIISILEDDLDNTSGDLIDQKTLTTSQMFERQFLRLASSSGSRDRGRRTSSRMPLSGGEMADLIGVSAEHLSRIKKRMINDGRLPGLLERFQCSPKERSADY